MPELRKRAMPSKFKIGKSASRIDLLSKRGLGKKELHYLNKNYFGKTNYFNSMIACTYGVNAAIFFNHISYWIKHNEKNNINYFEDKHWTYGTIEELTEMYFPYFSVSMLRTAIDKLLDDGIILRGNFNKHGYDQTIWYSVNDDRVKRIFDCSHIELLMVK